MLTGAQLEDVRAAVTAFTLRHRKMELFEGGMARGVTLAPVDTTADVLALEQLAVRDYWDQVRLPSGRALRAPERSSRRQPVAVARSWRSVASSSAVVCRRRSPGPCNRCR